MSTFISREPQVKLMESTVSQAEVHLGQLCMLLAAYTRRTAKLRDKADELVHQLNDFANTEDPELRTSLRILAEDLAMLQDYRQAQVERLETRVVTPLKAYGDIVKNKRADLKKFTNDRNRELKEIQRLERIRIKNPSDRQGISQAEASAQIASTNMLRSTRQLEETINNFQMQKLQDIKRIFTDFITIEMLFHTKSLEVYSSTFQSLNDMDIDKDLERFRSRIQVHDGLLDNKILQSSIPLSSTMPRYPSPTPSTLKQLSDYPRRQHHESTLQRQEEMEEEDEEEQEEEEGKKRESYAVKYTRMKRQQYGGL
ncbi:CBY1-interacting BAR domain-containing protein 2-like [Brienomyrus brachyistius]|uniref:CBY1-interacting BAR domain-containing protein 2-like n=1 Tax=Brienomyrus brachyistius TaxID=42636 RepID=UPI0020B239EA|nr:CBY1-interacting BAR domain-containing protein 2-like [Brienomyrus brachyistius]